MKPFVGHGKDSIEHFYNGLKFDTKMLLDVAAGGTMMTIDV